VKLSNDDVPFLLHDSSLDRTTNSTVVLGSAASKMTADAYPWDTLEQLDAGSWHSAAYAGEPLPSLETIAHFCLEHGLFLNIEIKPVSGSEHHTGTVVAQHAARLWQGAAVPPLLSSFGIETLAAAKAAQPQLPRALLLDNLWRSWLEVALDLQCVAIVCKHTLWDGASASAAQQQDFEL